MFATRSQLKHQRDGVEQDNGAIAKRQKNKPPPATDELGVLLTDPGKSTVDDTSSESGTGSSEEEDDEEEDDDDSVLSGEKVVGLDAGALQGDDVVGVSSDEVSTFHDENARSVRQRILLGQNGRRHGLPDTTLTVLNANNVGTGNTGGEAAKSARDLLLGFMASFDDTSSIGEHVEMTGGPVVVERNQNTGTEEAAIPLEVIRGLSHRAAPLVREKFMSDRVSDFVKTQLFRKVKFISSVNMCARALVIVMDALKILPPQRPAFVKMYESCVKGAINTKRSTCEQAGAKIVKELLIRKQHKPDDPEPPYDIKSLEKLRQCYKGTEQDLEAYVWFFGTFMECVAGKRGWGKKKYREEVSKAQVKGIGEMTMLVTVCDEAFALLLYENYIDKWMKKYHSEREIPAATGDANGNKGKKRMKGKFTKGSVGHCEFGGWSELGVRRYNELCTLAKLDRLDPQADKMEKFLLKRLQVDKYGDKDPTQLDDDNDDGDTDLSPAVEAYCEI